MILSLGLRRTSVVAFCPKSSIAKFSRTISTTSTINMSSNNNYWNREESLPQNFSKDIPISREAKIISLSNGDDSANDPLHKAKLPVGASLVGIGTTIDEFNIDQLQKEKPNVLFVSHPQSRKPLADLLTALPSIEWIHARSAGIDFVTSDALIEANNKRAIITNAKGCFSSTLAEYTMMACSYFAKDLPRLLKQKNAKNWEKYSVKEIRGSILGIVGYGDIGRAAAKLAKAYGMKVIALRRNPNKSPEDPYCDVVYGSDKDSLNKLFSESDYVLCAAPLTPETKGMIGKEQFDNAKDDAVFINVGRGPIVDEDAVIDALKTGKLKGAVLDVFAMEPLPKDSELWELENVLLSP